MLPYQTRVVEEKLDLDQKIERLVNFTGNELFNTLPDAEQARLSQQYLHMRDYSKVLGERIAAFES